VVTQEDFETLNELVTKFSGEKQPFERLVVKKEDALELFKVIIFLCNEETTYILFLQYNKYKHTILKEKVPENGTCTVYRCGNLIDPCRGPHIPHTGRVKGFKVVKNSSSYWKGDAKNDALQRVYGISYPTKDQLKEWERIQEEIAKRDHRTIGKQQELFFFHPLSPGSCFFLPHGTRIYNKLIEYIRSEYRNRGFTEVVTPNVFRYTNVF
jgi:threonyl-tRNA synthetase